MNKALAALGLVGAFEATPAVACQPLERRANLGPGSADLAVERGHSPHRLAAECHDEAPLERGSTCGRLGVYRRGAGVDRLPCVTLDPCPAMPRTC